MCLEHQASSIFLFRGCGNMETSTNVSSVEKEEGDVENRRDTVINDDHTRSHCQNDDKSEELLSPEKGM